MKPQLLQFQFDARMKQSTDDARAHFSAISSTIDTLHNIFEHYGKAVIEEHRFHPEAFIQCAIHTVYLKQHSRMASEYMNTSTGRFYNVRTETCRSCYPEMHDFESKRAYELLKRSVDKFQLLMQDVRGGRGWDRHLTGLYLTALLEGRKVPELYDDERVESANNYILSTSCGRY